MNQTMTPEIKIKHAILLKVAKLEDKPFNIEATPENIQAAYQALVDEDGHWDPMNEIREGEVETELPCDWSSHYESKSVAAKMPDGSWVGWTYWFGGGKHGEPYAIEWMEEAYDLEIVETKTVVVNVFKKVELVQL